MISKLRVKLIQVLFLILVMQISWAYASQGGLSLVAVTLVNGENLQGAADVPTQPQFQVQFDRNVISYLVWKNNSQCFSLVTQNNVSVPISVTKGDESSDPSQRRIIYVQPTNPLSPGTSYSLIISPNIAAKNGSTLADENGQAIVITFTTAPASQS